MKTVSQSKPPKMFHFTDARMLHLADSSMYKQISKWDTFHVFHAIRARIGRGSYTWEVIRAEVLKETGGKVWPGYLWTWLDKVFSRPVTEAEIADDAANVVWRAERAAQKDS